MSEGKRDQRMGLSLTRDEAERISRAAALEGIEPTPWAARAAVEKADAMLAAHQEELRQAAMNQVLDALVAMSENTRHAFIASIAKPWLLSTEEITLARCWRLAEDVAALHRLYQIPADLLSHPDVPGKPPWSAEAVLLQMAIYILHRPRDLAEAKRLAAQIEGVYRKRSAAVQEAARTLQFALDQGEVAAAQWCRDVLASRPSSTAQAARPPRGSSP